MKRAVFAFLVVGMVVTFGFVGCTDAKQTPKVTMATENRQVTDFNEIVLEGPGQIYLKQGETEALKIEAGNDIINEILSDVSGGTLKIITESEGIRQPGLEEIKLYIMVKEPEKIVLRGAGMVKTDGPIKIDKLAVVIAGAGEADLNLTGDTLSVEISGAGRVMTRGQVDKQIIRISGVGQYDALKLKSEDAEINISGAGAADVDVSDELDITISGTGRVTYTGSPKITQKISGRGKVQAKTKQP